MGPLTGDLRRVCRSICNCASVDAFVSTSWAAPMDDIPRPLKLSRPRFLNLVRASMRERNLAYSTEQTYLHWIRRYIRFHDRRHPAQMGSAQVDAFLSWLATEKNVSPSTQSIALNALVFLYERFLEQPLGQLGYQRPKLRRRIPQVLTHVEAMDIINRLQAPASLMVRLMYGSGLRLIETCRLRIKDIDFGMQELLGHSDLATNEIYTQVLNRGGRGVVSPVDQPS